ncbi:hypothetical protein [Paraburkholderia rhizosphaerae]|uniref:Rap1a immunity protein domain-containing protein n=1 Tax=Paraburkholderia rhizosphaerae TaxID=480658 RepID=A0A4R8LYQ0_9BURK|nr:hypothetical protein [Paraburkholderia rhizosphaerae]TDY53192.1 hypothetical protein BX592_1032 [Paraburkholderia rhizosphaerae]
MQPHLPRSVARITAVWLCAVLSGFASHAQAQTGKPAAPPKPAAQTQQQPSQPSARPAVDPTFSAYKLAHLCGSKDDNVAQGQCLGAIRGIIHGYQYGVLFLAQRKSLPAGETQRVSLCLQDVRVSSIIDDFLSDTSQVDADALKATPAEVALLGSVHMHHPCS